eukprot:UN04096
MIQELQVQEGDKEDDLIPILKWMNEQQEEHILLLLFES